MTHRSRALFGAPLVFVLAAFVIAGCSAGRALAGESGGGHSGSSGTGIVVPDPGAGSNAGAKPDEPVGGGGGGAPPDSGDGALHVTPQPDIVNPIPHAFDHLTVSGDGLTVTVYYWGGVDACYGLASVDIRHAPGEPVVVTVLEGARRSAEGAACIDIALLKAVTVTLDEPLVVAGAVDVGA